MITFLPVWSADLTLFLLNTHHDHIGLLHSVRTYGGLNRPIFIQLYSDIGPFGPLYIPPTGAVLYSMKPLVY